MQSPDDDTALASILDGLPMVAVVVGMLLIAEMCINRERAWWPIVSGSIAFVVAWCAHLLFSKRVKLDYGLGDVSSDAFSSFTTLIGLVFSLLLGQTFSYYFDRQGAIQDSTFREVAELQRLLELCLSLFQGLGDFDAPVLRPLTESPQSQTQLTLRTSSNERRVVILELIEAEAARLAPGGNGLDETTKLVSRHRAISGVVQHLNELSSSERTHRNKMHDPSTLASLNAAQQAVSQICEARALRVSQINADLPPAQFLTLNLLGALLLGSFLLMDLKNDQLEAALFGAIVGAATVFKQVLGDLSAPTSGSWSVEPARQAGYDLLMLVRDEIDMARGGKPCEDASQPKPRQRSKASPVRERPRANQPWTPGAE